MEVPSLKPELRELIARYLELYYVSESSKDGIKTENRYQSVRLGELESAGVRSVRDAFLDRIDFAGKTVLDLGSNLGELSRGARARGASLVDGYEYDPFFVELASAIDAYGQVTRVSHHRRDVTDAEIYTDHYDVVLAFSVFVYVEPVLDRIASITDKLFVLETHRLEGDNLVDYYVRVIGRHFPHYVILGESDWDLRLGGEGDRRAILAFAKDEPTLLEALHEPGQGAAAPNLLKVAVAHKPGSGAPVRHLHIDLANRPLMALQQRFFMMFRFDSLDELFDAIDGMDIDVASLVKSREIKNLGSEGWVYWFLFTKGYVQYLKTGEISPGNAYFDYLLGHYMEHGHDPSAGWDPDEHETAVERVARRFRDFDTMRRLVAEGPEPPPGTKPVRITLRDVPRDPPLQLYEVGSEEPLPVRYIDGWHRLCSARLSGLSSFPCEAIPEHLHDKPIRSAVEHFAFDGARLELRGWAFDPDAMVNFELRAGRRILAKAAPAERPDVGDAFPDIPLARSSGFEFDVECTLPADVPVRFDLVVMDEIFPVGAVPLVHVPGPLGGTVPTLVYELLRPLVRRRALESFASVLVVEQGEAPVAEALAHLVPKASVTRLDADALAAAPDSADLVIAHDVLPSMSRDRQLAFLESARAALREGGHAVATVLGELVAERDPARARTVQARDDTIEAFSRRLEVLDYVKGGVGGLHDLILLRKS
ncbi:MAG: hypothetical protein C5B48_10660 [Candidatus Rokuibacteriota bacterium]|nr:MAG: hypothetical protein C5B48_10660 [Candidatus Rokubacteria bacterium]